jgi:hypothetical protein
MYEEEIDYVVARYVIPEVAGLHLDYSLGQEAALFGPPKDKPLKLGVGYNSHQQRRSAGLPYYLATGMVYRQWGNMMNRAYGAKLETRGICTVCPIWHDYQEYARWYYEQPYADYPDAELDKDILRPKNTVYCPEYCSIVPAIMNRIFRDTRRVRGVLPIGVYIAPSGEGVIVRLSKHGVLHYVGRYVCITQAYKAYQKHHRAYCSELADMYEGKVDNRVVERLRRYKRHVRD